MDSQYNKEKKAQGVYEDDIYFGSLSENKLYKLLVKYKENYHLGVHQPLILGDSDNHKWKVDFTLRPKTYSDMQAMRNLLYICNEEIITEHIGEIYIEYKGWNDENFKRHMMYMIERKSDVLKRLILISDKPSAFIIEYPHSRGRYKKLITSLKSLQFWLNDVYC